MLLKRLKLHLITTIFRWWYTKFSRHIHTHKHAKLYHLTTLFDNSNAVSNHEKGDQIVRGVFCQTFTKSCQIINNIVKILPKFLHLTIYFNNGPNTNWVTVGYLDKFRNLKVGG